MPESGSSFKQAYNAQAVVDTESMLIVAGHASQQTNDKQEVEPALDRIAKLPKELGTIDTLLADSGYFSETNVTRCEEKEMAEYRLYCTLAFGIERLAANCLEPMFHLGDRIGIIGERRWFSESLYEGLVVDFTANGKGRTRRMGSGLHGLEPEKVTCLDCLGQMRLRKSKKAFNLRQKTF